MTPEQLYEYLEHLAEQLGISVRHEHLCHQEVRASSGLCRVGGKLCYIMDLEKPLQDRIRLLGSCLRRMDLEEVYVLPGVRRWLEREGAEDKGKDKS